MEIIDLLRDLGIFGIAALFFQHLIKKSADRKFESYKTELDQKTREFQLTLDSKMELFRTELNLQNYKSTKVYERQLNVIIELHKKLIKLNREMQIMTAFLKPVHNDAEQEETDRIKNAADSYNDFMFFYQDNMIFLPEKTVEKLHEVRDDYWSSYNDYTFGHNYGIRSEFSFDKSVAAGERVRNKIQPAVDQLVMDFKLFLGVEIMDTN